MRSSLHDPDWDLAWAGYDRSIPALPVPRPVADQGQRGNRQAKRSALPLMVALAMAVPASLPTGRGAAPGLPRDALISLSPAERLLPPVDAAIARLSIESASAACWVQQLRPEGGSCAEGAAAR